MGIYIIPFAGYWTDSIYYTSSDFLSDPFIANGARYILTHIYIKYSTTAFRAAVGIHRRHRPTYKSIIYIDSYIEIDKLLLCCLYWDIYAQKKRLKVSAPFDGPYIVSLKAYSKEEEDLFYKVKYRQYLYI